MSLFCRIGFHRWKFKYVETKVRFEHLKAEEWDTVDEMKLRHGRECRWCGKEQYTWMPWISFYYFDVIKDEGNNSGGS